ncbi:MAG: Stk1 family PASTA domain-containing Ser/Thr kinase [Clostridia bacterium]|nr:Stk1 family PASTA domain-containing Ser/Thr kinase [Clostridia bacterium]
MTDDSINIDAEMIDIMMTGKMIANRYEIIEEVGKGGMAVVYKAKCLVLNRYVAIKVLRPEFREDTDFIARFKAEAQSAGSLSHPNIVSIYDVGQEGDLDYIVMEYVEGVTLKQYIDAKAIIPWKEAVDYAAQICSGLEHAHKKGIVHKDIKPHNIIITREGTLKITDFGIAKVMSTSTITTGGAAGMGSVHYFSPEQARGGYIDAKTDIYSLGILMYEMVTGRLPFEGDTAVAVAMQHIEKEPVPPCSLNKDIPQSRENVILRAMSKEQNMRYDTATKMMIDLKKVYLGTPVAFDRQLADGETMVVPKIPEKEHVIPDEILVQGEKQKKSKPQKSAQDKKKDRLGVIAGILTGVLLVAILGAGYYFFMTPAGNEIKLPDFTNMTVEEAKETVKNTDIEIIVEEEQKSDSVDKGKIISQDPKANKNVKDNAKVKVIVSLGGDGGTMPDLVKRKDSDAQEIIRNLKLIPNVVSEISEDIPQGYVVRQSPVMGAKYAEGDTVTIYVSSGKDEKFVAVPNLLGKTEDEAKAALLDVGLTWGSIATIESSRAKGTVAAQSIQAGVEVKEKTSVDFRLSSGPKTTTESSAPSDDDTKTSEPASEPTQKPSIKPMAPNA